MDRENRSRWSHIVLPTNASHLINFNQGSNLVISSKNTRNEFLLAEARSASASGRTNLEAEGRDFV